MARQPGVPNMSNDDKLTLLKAMKAIVPIGTEEWKAVQKKYNSLQAAYAAKKNVPVVPRIAKTLERQWSTMEKLKKPPGKCKSSLLH